MIYKLKVHQLSFRETKTRLQIKEQTLTHKQKTKGGTGRDN